jgi:hypothetical protein
MLRMLSEEAKAAVARVQFRAKVLSRMNKGRYFERQREEYMRQRAEVVEKYGVETVPGCNLCRYYSLFGGPPHEANPNCKSGGRPHCSCEICEE